MGITILDFGGHERRVEHFAIRRQGGIKIFMPPVVLIFHGINQRFAQNILPLCNTTVKNKVEKKVDYKNLYINYVVTMQF